MAKDYTKYAIEGVAENLGKSKLALAIIENYVSTNQVDFAILNAAFPDECQGGIHGVFRKKEDVKDFKRYYMDKPITLIDGSTIVVSNQWGIDNIPGLIDRANKLGYVINKVNETEESSISYKDNKIAIAFIDLFKNKNLNIDFLSEFIKPAEELLKMYNSEIPAEAKAIDDVFEEIMVYAAKEPLLLGGYAYIFTYVAQKFDHWLDFSEELIKENAYKWDDMVSSGKNPVALVCEESTEDNFKSIFISRMMFTLNTIVMDADAKELAELIVSCDMDKYTFSEDEECWICDLVVDMLDVFGFSLDDYEGECEIDSRNFLDGGRTMGYDYIGLSQNFIGTFA
jgi:hypothetical protein